MQNLVGIDLAVMVLCMRQKTRFCMDFLLTYPSIRFFVVATGHSFGVILMLNGSND